MMLLCVSMEVISMKNKWIKELTPALLLSLSAGFMLFLFAPLEIYFNNKYEFWFDFYTLFPVCLLMFLIFFVISVVVFFCVYKLNNKVYQGLLLLSIIAFLCTYIQGNYMVGNLPHLDGSLIDWSKYDVQRMHSILLWVLVGTLVFVGIRRFTTEKVVKIGGIVSGALFLILLMTVTTVGIMNRGLEKKLDISNSMNYALEMSTDQNYVMILLDAADGEEMSKLIEKHPEYREVLADFTYFNNTMGSYPYTLYSIPYIFSGEWYENQEDYMEYGKRVYRTASFFDELEEKSYRIGLYEPEAFMLEESMLRFENVVNNRGELSSVKDLIKLELKLVGFKYMPYDLKKFCVSLPEEITNLRTLDEVNVGEPCTGNNQKFYSFIRNNDVTLTSDKCFRYFHLEGAHAPWHYDADVNEVEEGTYEQSLEASMTIVTEYLQKLKDSDVYDNTAIMILADHGYNKDNDVNSEGRQHPILFVKGIGESHDTLQISEAPISQTDFREAYTRLLDGKSSSEVFDFQEGDYRERRYLYYEYDENTYFKECVQTGHAKDEETLVFTGVEIIP